MTASAVRSRVLSGLVAASSVLALAACSAGTASESTAERSSSTSASVMIPNVTSASVPATVDAANEQVENGEAMQIDIQVGERIVVGTLNDTAASRDLAAQLPLTLNLSDHGSVEKTGRLPAELSTDGAPGSADPNPGDIGYYAPGNDFVLYYGDQSEFPGIVILGSMDRTGSDTVGSIDGDVTVTVSRSE
ncbi:hypothetical protein CH275_13310 [Rhodococcus sp. 06-235-1A]|uniref:cyclophilin-like fold protein n=1 Tax=Rhodococcus sp. 06-235-1A TaxID=2022508 RepID=UPI000B9A2A3C|nr:cyclophilin-like fold protein [Rhodococcus sp. 06-235-1A]OZD04241.1 hypothetical protein CH275_13310 [Rhodococcus sp. 06-235-1A]